MIEKPYHRWTIKVIWFNYKMLKEKSIYFVPSVYIQEISIPQDLDRVIQVAPLSPNLCLRPHFELIPPYCSFDPCIHLTLPDSFQLTRGKSRKKRTQKTVTRNPGWNPTTIPFPLFERKCESKFPTNWNLYQTHALDSEFL